MPTNRYGIYYPTSSSESESEDEAPPKSTKIGANLGTYSRPQIEAPRIIRPDVTPVQRPLAKSDESEDESEEKKSFSEKGESSEDVSRGKAVKDHLFSNENSEHEEEETDDEVENSDELALDDIDIKETSLAPPPAHASPPNAITPTRKYNRSASNASSMQPQMKHGLDLDEINRKKVEKDLCELQTLINYHFEERKKEEIELVELKDRIEKRKKMRQEQLVIRRQREKERRERAKIERLEKEREVKAKLEEEETKRKEQLASMSMHFGGYAERADRRKGRRNTARDAKRRALAERRKPLNIDHLNKEKLIEKTQEIYDWLLLLETERYDHDRKITYQKYELSTLRHRVNDLINKSGKNKPRVGKLKIPTM